MLKCFIYENITFFSESAKDIPTTDDNYEYFLSKLSNVKKTETVL